jgi:predicted  nucleic acid-binding Zn-ribbon protein
LSRVNRLEKENQERALREFSKKVKELEEELEAVRSAMQGAEKRAGKIEEARVEEVAKLKGQLVEAERQREMVGG